MKKIRILLIFLLSTVFCFSAFKVASYYYQKYISAKVYSNVISDVVSGNIDDIKKENPVPFDIDFKELKSKNQDVVGWIYLPNSPINYPVLQGVDNNQYLRRLIDGKYNPDGSIFVDYRNGDLKQDKNYIIYGHNMKSGTMFSCLENYNSQEFYESNPVIYYITPDCKYKINLYAGFVAENNSDTYSINADEEKFSGYMLGAKNSSTFKSDIEYTSDSKVVTLSTCYSKNDRYRYVVLGILEDYQ